MADELHCTLDKKQKRLVLTGSLTVRQLPHAADQLQATLKDAKGATAIDISGLDKLDTAGALLLCDASATLPIAGAGDDHLALLELIGGLTIAVPPAQHCKPPIAATLIAIGRWAEESWHETCRVLAFMGQAAVALVHTVPHPKRLRLNSIAHHIDAVGIAALPIIGLIAFLISVVLAYQGVAQLRPYGGQQFTVDLVAISILREMGVLLTAIMVAGRSGSAFTAEIGVMKAREEIDALSVMGLDPFEILVLPRLIAIIIALPLLTFFANMLGLVGGYFITAQLIDIHLNEYMQRIHIAAQGEDLLVGLIKAPVFAFFIGIIGCMHGLRVTGSAESIGRETTRSVVKSIFFVLVLDAFFSIFFEQVGL